MTDLLCTKCNTVKPLDRFPVVKKGRGGRDWQCRDCKNKYQREYVRKVKQISEEKLMKYFNYKVQMIKYQDKNRFPEHESSLTPKDLLDVYKKYNGICVYSNKKLKPGSKVSIYAKISFDRIDNSLPHEKDNLQLASVFMNMLRADKDHAEFIGYIKSFE